MNKRMVKANGGRTTSAIDWVGAAREFLISKGIAEVKVEPIARALNVTPGSFYWHFKNRPALYDALLRNWLASNVVPFFALYNEAVDDPHEQYLALAYAWVLSSDFDPAFDVAVRDWGRSTPKVNRLLRAIDRKCIALYEDLFARFGQEPRDAAVRARAMYYHQIGYYAMRIEEPLDDRLMLVPHYAAMFTGVDLMADCQTAQDVRSRLTGFRRRQPAAEQNFANENWELKSANS